MSVLVCVQYVINTYTYTKPSCNTYTCTCAVVLIVLGSDASVCVCVRVFLLAGFYPISVPKKIATTSSTNLSSIHAAKSRPVSSVSRLTFPLMFVYCLLLKHDTPLPSPFPWILQRLLMMVLRLSRQSNATANAHLPVTNVALIKSCSCLTVDPPP